MFIWCCLLNVFDKICLIRTVCEYSICLQFANYYATLKYPTVNNITVTII